MGFLAFTSQAVTRDGILAVFTGSPEAERAIELAARIAAQRNVALTVIVTHPVAEGWSEQTLAKLAARAGHVSIIESGGRLLEVLRRRPTRPQMVVLPVDLAPADQAAVRALDVPTLVIRGRQSSEGGKMKSVLFALGFRPFFLVAALLGAFWIPLWLIAFYGGAALDAPLPGALWHGHEMIFGYAGAVIAGFLLTAAHNWTGQDTARGAGLAALWALWVLSRAANLSALVPEAALALIDPLFFLAVAIALFRPLWRTGNRRNLPLVAVVLGFGLLDGLTHLGVAGAIAWSPQSVLRVAVDLVVVLMVVIGGRVIPMFTKNAVLDAPVRRVAWFDRLAIASVLAALVSEATLGLGQVTAAIFLVASATNLLRLATWGGIATFRRPILWVLHLGYLWIGVGLGLRGASVFFDAVPETMGLHALTAGAIGTLTMGMMARVSLGHTGRPMVAHPMTAAAFGLVSLAALLRIISPVMLEVYDPLMMVSGALWTVAFVLFVVVYAPILTLPRVGGRAA